MAGGAVTVDTDGGGDYSTLSDCESTENTGTYTEDLVVTCTGATDDTTACDWDGGTPYIYFTNICAAAGDEAETGGINTSKYLFNNLFTCNDDSVLLKRLQIKQASGTYAVRIRASYCHVEGCFIEGHASGNHGIYFNSGSYATVQNNILNGNGNAYTGLYVNTNNHYAIGNAVYDFDTGLNNNNMTGTYYYDNWLLNNGSYGFYAIGGGACYEDYNIVDDTSSKGSNSKQNIDITDTPPGTSGYVVVTDLTAGSEDFALVNDVNCEAIGAGIGYASGAYAPFYDFFRNNRGGASCDIGPHEYSPFDNNYASDSDCVALFEFEEGALGTDTIGSTTLTPQNSAPNSRRYYTQGNAGARFNETSTWCLTCTDGNLDSDFPLKSGDSYKKFSITGWFYLTNVTTNNCFWAKYDNSTNQRSFFFGCDSTSNQMRLWFGYNSGNNAEEIDLGPTLSTGIWYHFGVTVDDSDKSYKVRLRQKGGSATNYSGNYTNSLYVGTGGFGIGRIVVSGYLSGAMDEVATWQNRTLSDDDIDDIYNRVYSLGLSPSISDSFSFSESLALVPYPPAFDILDALSFAESINLLLQPEFLGSAATPSDRDGVSTADYTYVFDEVYAGPGGYITEIEIYINSALTGALDFAVFSKSGTTFTDDHAVLALAISNGYNIYKHSEGDFDANDLPIATGEYIGLYLTNNALFDRWEAGGPGPGYWYDQYDQISGTPAGTTFTLSGNSTYELQVRVKIQSSLDLELSVSETFGFSELIGRNLPLPMNTSDNVSLQDVLQALQDLGLINVFDTISLTSQVVEVDGLVVSGTVCWGHDTGVTQTNILDLSRWTGTGTVTGSGDNEAIQMVTGQYMESEIVNVGVNPVSLNLNVYQTGKGAGLIIRYKDGNTIENCDADSWHVYSGGVSSTGFVKFRIEA